MRTEPTPKPIICFTCDSWVPYACVLAGQHVERWRCTNGVVNCGARTDCPCWIRAIGSEPW